MATDKLRDSIVQALSDGEALQCTRVWEAWQYNTMTDGDFAEASEGPLPDEILAAILPLIEAERVKAAHDAWEKGWEAAIDQAPGDVFFDEWHYQTNPYPAPEETP